MAAKREYKQRCDNPAILSAMKVSSCEMSVRQDSSGSPSSVYFRNAGPRSDSVPSRLRPDTNTTGSSINNRPGFIGGSTHIRFSLFIIFYGEWFINLRCISVTSGDECRHMLLLIKISANNCRDAVVFHQLEGGGGGGGVLLKSITKA